MSQMTTSQVRIVDPVLTTVAQGYQNNEFIASALFPSVSVQQRGGHIITFGTEDFEVLMTQRAPGENIKEVQFGYAGAPYALVDRALAARVPIEHIEDGRSFPGIDIIALNIRKTMNRMNLEAEVRAAQLARNPTNYASENKTTLSAGGKWSAETSDPCEDIEVAKEAIRSKTGKSANTVVIGASVLAKLRNNPKIVDRIKYTGRDVPTVELLAALFDVEKVLIGRAISKAGPAAPFADVWGKDVIVAYTEMATLAEAGTPSYGYTYTLDGYPLVEEGTYDPHRRSWFFPISRAESEVIAAPDAGYLITSAVA